MSLEAPVLAVRSLSKSFSGIPVLRDVALTVARQEIFGLLGRNGSGKSTLVKILAGVLAPDPGAEIAIDGSTVALPLPSDGLAGRGVRFVHQNLGLCASLTVLENLFMGEIAQSSRMFLDWRALRRRAAALLEALEITLPLDAPVERLLPVERAQLALVRAFSDIAGAGPAPRLIVLDEPTPFLPRHDVERLFALMRRGVARGASIVFITHDVDEVVEITDRVAILRDGLLVGTLETIRTSASSIVEMIVGESVADGRIEATPATAGAATVRVTGAASPRLAPIDLDLRAGEIVGLTGLVGSGYDELPQLLFGARRASGGSLTLADATIALENLSPAVAMAHGFGFVPADRNGAGCVADLEVGDNILLPSLDAFGSAPRLDRPAMRAAAAKACTDFAIRPPKPSALVRTLSGGNAQKVLLARWLRRDTRLLLLVEPTQGVDVGTRRQIMETLRGAADAGAVILCATSDAEQLADLCDRVAVFSQGRLSRWVKGSDLTKQGLVAACYAAAERLAAAGAAS